MVRKRLKHPPSRIPRKTIHKLAREIATRFHPEKIILFGSHAYGRPHPDSDVDLLVIMPTKNMLGQAVRICQAMDYHFPLDLMVRTPEFFVKTLS